MFRSQRLYPHSGMLHLDRTPPLGDNMKRTRQLSPPFKQAPIGALLLTVAACSPARVQPVQTYAGATLPRPSVVVVSDFAVTQNDVKLDSGVGSRLKSLFSSTPEDEQQLETGRKVAAAVSKTL